MDLPKAFMEANENIGEDQIIDLIVECEKKIKDLEKEKAEDTQLANAKEIVKTLGSGYSSSMKLEKKKIKWLLGKLEEIQENLVNKNTSNF